jgi:hypothetical protein
MAVFIDDSDISEDSNISNNSAEDYEQHYY